MADTPLGSPDPAESEVSRLNHGFDETLVDAGGAGSFSEFGTITWYFSCIFPLAMFLTIFSNYDVNFL